MSEEGKSVKVTEAHIAKVTKKNELAGQLLGILKLSIEMLFPDATLSVQKPSFIRIHQKELNQEEILALAAMVKENEASDQPIRIFIKRSGPGITIIFDLLNVMKAA